MIVKSFGCSFIFGTDLPDDGQEKFYPKSSRYSWPSLIARRHGHQYCCYARPGAGNLQIMERILSQAATNEQALFIIQWTWIDRFDYTNSRDKWMTLLPMDSCDKSRFYFRRMHSQFKDKLTTLGYIRLAIDTLKQKGCPFIMTYMDDLIFEHQWHATPAVTDLQQYVRPYLTNFEGLNFLEWAHDRGYPISDSKHPLEQAHAAAADLILDQWTDYVRS